MTLDFPSATRPQTKMMTVDDVIRLSKAGLSDDVIIQQIRNKNKDQSINLSTDQLLQLKGAHVSDRVIGMLSNPDGSALTQDASAVAEVVKRSSESVVQIVVSDASGQQAALGSGFLISADGRIVTNDHVIKGGHSAIVKLTNGAFFPVEGILAADPDKDIAIIKVAGKNLPFLALANSDAVHVGDHVVAIGSPLGLEGTVSDGIISALREDGPNKWIQTTAPVSHGNSGGPLLDLQTNVVGVITWGVDLQLGQNLNFAAPSDEVKSILLAIHSPTPLDSINEAGVSAMASAHAGHGELNGGLKALSWESTTKSDPLTGHSYKSFVLTGRYLSPPSNARATAPVISLRCDASPHHRMSGKLLAGFIDVGTVIDIENGQESTVKYRLDDGKLQTASRFEVGYSTDYQAIAIEDIFLDNLLWGHLIPHKPHSSGQVHKVVISVREHLDGDVVMEFDMPEAQAVGAACGTEYKN